MFLKIFTAFIIFLISRILTLDFVYKNIDYKESFNVTVNGTANFNTSVITNANVSIYLFSSILNGIVEKELINGTEFNLSMYKPRSYYLENMFVRFKYLNKGIYNSFDKEIPEDCKNKDEEIEFPSFGIKYLKKENFNCDLGTIKIE